MKIDQILYQLYLLGFRTGEIAAEMEVELPLTVPPIAHLLRAAKPRMVVMEVMSTGYGHGACSLDERSDPMTFAQFDMHVLEDLDY